MGWLVGLPLGIFKLLFTVVMLAVRFALPLALIVVIFVVLRRRGAGSHVKGKAEKPREPEFHGPVYTVDYKEVKDDKD